MNFIIKFLILTAILSMFILLCNNGQYIHVSSTNDFKSVVGFLLALVLLNISVKPILKILTFPLNCLTFGLFSFVVNYIIVYFADEIVDTFEFTDWKYAFVFSILFALASSVIDHFLKDKD